MISRLLPASLLLGFALLTGCSTFNDNELGIIRGSGVTPRLYTKMQDGRPLRPEDVIELTRRHVPERYIVKQIEDVGVDYVLSPEDYKRLQGARIDRAVIDALITASDEFASRYAVPRQHIYYGGPDPYFYDDPYYDAGSFPVHGDIGIGFSTGRGHWRR